jgi:hypothetical protein
VQVRLVQNQDETRVELDGEDITDKLTSWAVTVSPGEPSHVELRGGLWSYEGAAEVTVDYRHEVRVLWPTPPTLREDADNASL